MTHPMISPCVFCGEFMPTQAMSFSFIQCPRTIATQGVFATAHHLKMVWIHAPSFPAQVINCHFLRDCLTRPFIRDSMRKIVIMPIKPKARVAALGMKVTNPLPTAGLYDPDLANELDKSRFIRRVNIGFDNYRIKLSQCSLPRIFTVIGVLARYATPVQAIRCMRQNIKRGFEFVRLTYWARFHSCIIPNYIRTCNGLASREAHYAKALEIFSS